MRRPRAVSEKFNANLRDRIGAKGKLMVDSGGYVLMTKQDSRWNVRRVSSLYDRIDADHLVSLDVPPSAGDSKRDRVSKYEKTLRNLEKQFQQFGKRIVPVVHGVTDLETEHNCQRIKQLFPSPSVIGIGGLVPILQKCGSARKSGLFTPQRRIANAVRCVHAHFPHSRIHLFGVGSLHTVLGVTALGGRSVDSIGWRQAAGFGSVFIPGRHRRLLTLRERANPCRPFANEDDLDLLSQCRCPTCRMDTRPASQIARLAHHYKPRAVHNIWVLYAEIAGYFHASQMGTASAFLSSRLSEAWIEAIELRQEI